LNPFARLGRISASPFLIGLLFTCAGQPLYAALPSIGSLPLADRLDSIRGRVQVLEQQLADSLKENDAATGNLHSLRVLIQLQAQEAELGRQRKEELEKTINELDQRKVLLSEKIQLEQKQARDALAAIHRSLQETPRSVHLAQGEELEAPRRQVMGNIVSKNLRELEALRIDLEDANHLEARISEEKAQLEWLFHDLEERRGILELNRSIQADLLKKRQAERLAQLENYRKLKVSESEVSRLIRDFNARKELERAVELERAQNKSVAQATSLGMKGFEQLQGSLPLPVVGARIAAGFGRSLDQASGLQVFRKGIDLAVPASSAVRAVHGGKVAFSGEMPGYGRITIVDHGEHFYTLYGRLGALEHREGDIIRKGEALGSSDAAGGELYFEIRARNIPVNPVGWIMASTR
jgi:septal ring factor EnvC (AmiA/AmiB activator)